jgi:hypothetical protein
MKVGDNVYFRIDISLLHKLSKSDGGGVMRKFEKSIGLIFYDEDPTLDLYIYTVKDKDKLLFGILKYGLPLDYYKYPKY